MRGGWDPDTGKRAEPGEEVLHPALFVAFNRFYQGLLPHRSVLTLP
jgi:hypothetical protein